jgi:hypothetical protein
MAKIKGYKPPKVGDVVFIHKTYMGWASGTQVTVQEVDLPAETAKVWHGGTKQEFDVPVELLVRKRNRSGE